MAVSSEAELRVQRRLTKFFIDANPSTISLEPWKREPNGTGGYVLSPQPPRSPQVMRLISLYSGGKEVERNTLDGKVVRPGFMLMGEHDALIERGDRFVLNGKRYEIAHVQEYRDFQTKGETVLLGDA